MTKNYNNNINSNSNSNSSHFAGNRNSGSNQNRKIARYIVEMAPQDDTNDNFVTYSTGIDRLRVGDHALASALAHAKFTSRLYNGRISVQYEDGIVESL